MLSLYSSLLIREAEGRVREKLDGTLVCENAVRELVLNTSLVVDQVTAEAESFFLIYPLDELAVFWPTSLPSELPPASLAGGERRYSAVVVPEYALDLSGAQFIVLNVKSMDDVLVVSYFAATSPSQLSCDGAGASLSSQKRNYTLPTHIDLLLG